MTICGMQKLTLLDYPERVGCTLFTGGCNFRCPFCHNSSLISPDERPIERDEVFNFLKKRAGLLDAVCISGGEPLMHADIGNFIRQVKELGYLVKIDTNGSFPKELGRLVSDKLVDYVAMDIKNSPRRYAETVGLPHYDLSPVRESVCLLLGGEVPYEFRTTVVKEYHGPEDFISIGRWLKGAERYFLQAFENSGDVRVSGLNACSASEMLKFRELLLPYIPGASVRSK